MRSEADERLALEAGQERLQAPPLSRIDCTFAVRAKPNSDRYSRLRMIPSPAGSVCGRRNLNGVANGVHLATSTQLHFGKP